MPKIDLRSDTVTVPTPAMREAMARAQVGDDVYGEDPTVNQLQAMAADLLGKQAGLFVPSGTMGNLAAILAHCQRGDEAILGDQAHIFLFEAGGVSALGGVHSHQLPNQADGTLRMEDIRSAVRKDDPHQPVTRLIALENTHNRCGGVAISAEYTQAVGQMAHERNLVLHMDGARIFNAAASLGVSARQLVEPADSVTFCLSKGLSAPVGSVLCGSHEFIHKAHRIRKQLGGGMRQAGILAAAGIVALETMTGRLEEDHAHAKRLAQGLASIPGISLFLGAPQSNMVFCALGEQVELSTRQVVEKLDAFGVQVGVVGSRHFRLVTHFWIGEAEVDAAIQAFAGVISG